MDKVRKSELRGILMARRKEVADNVVQKLHDIRADGESRFDHGHGNDQNDEDAQMSVQQEIDLTLIQLRADTLNRIDQALGRLDRDVYGNCAECGDQIAEKRLRALPFAIRCKDCEEKLETAQTSDKKLKGVNDFVSVDPVRLILE